MSGTMAHPRLAREERTVEAMVRIYCRAHHHSSVPCAECIALTAYTRERLARCPYQERKPTCAKCPIHCYRPAERERIRTIMRYAGPRMLYRHPILALRHLADGRRRPAPPVRDRS